MTTVTMSTVLIPAPPALTPLEAAKATLVQLEQAIAAMPERRDVLNTDRALEAHDARQLGLSLAHTRIKNALRFVPAAQREREAVSTWIAHLTAWRAECAEQLSAAELPNPTREAQDARQRLQHAVRVIDGGADFWDGRAGIGQWLTERICATYPPRWGLTDPWECGFGPLPSAQARLKQAEQQLADAQQILDAAMADATRLLT